MDAAYKAIDTITKIPGKLLGYQLRAVTEGKDAIGEVKVTVEMDGQQLTGRGTSTDVIEASVRAYLNAVNRYVARPGGKPPVGENV